MPLWTIFTKCPAPGGADVRVAVLGRERGEDRLEPLHRRRRRRRPSGSSRSRGPRCRRRRRRRRSGCPSPPPARSGAASRGSSSCRRRRRVAASSELEQLLERVLGIVAGRDHQPERARRLELVHSSSSVPAVARRPGRTSSRRARAPEAGHHVAAHAAEADHSELHQMSSSRTRTTRRPRSAATESPAACARISRRSRTAAGDLSSSPVSSTTWTKRPVVGPPLCSWPVECR